MKTIRQWFIDTLPKEDADKAIKYTPADILDTASESFEGALIDSFVWDGTDEGHDYWALMAEKYSLPVQE